MRRAARAVAVPVAGLLVAGLLLTGCATGDGGSDATPVDVPSSDPVGLVGLWRVSGAEGESERTWLRLADGSYQLWRDCAGFVEGGWEASSRAFVASEPYLANGDCPVEPWPSVPWLAAARAYRPANDVGGSGGWELLDAAGEALARLTVDGGPDPIPSTLPEYAEAPEITDDLRASFAEPAPLDAGLMPASARHLAGRWVPATGARNGAYVELSADGSWSGSDGCNETRGAWGVDDGGRLLATSGISTAMACDGAAVPYWLSAAARAGFAGPVLVLVDRDGTELARLLHG